MQRNKFLIIVGMLVIFALGFLFGLWNRFVFSQEESFIEEVIQLEGEQANIPKSYGRLAAVSIEHGAHHMFFEAEDGTIRVVIASRPEKRSTAKHKLVVPERKVFLFNRE